MPQAKMFKFLKIKFTMHDGNKVRTNNKYADIYVSTVPSRKPQNGIVGMDHTQVKHVSTFSTLRRCWLVPQKLVAWDFLIGCSIVLTPRLTVDGRCILAVVTIRLYGYMDTNILNKQRETSRNIKEISLKINM
jgi:hypothetical protein